MKLARYVVEDN